MNFCTGLGVVIGLLTLGQGFLMKRLMIVKFQKKHASLTVHFGFTGWILGIFKRFYWSGFNRCCWAFYSWKAMFWGREEFQDLNKITFWYWLNVGHIKSNFGVLR